MRYADVESNLERCIDTATSDGKRALTVHAVQRLTQLDGVDEVAADEFTPEALDAFHAACANPVSADAQTLTTWLDILEEGTLSNGDMDPFVLWALTALDAWRDYQQDEDSSSVFTVAHTLLEVVDFEMGGADLDDFLADPRMSAQFDEIQSLLASPLSQ
ncbi:hypothetical protein [Streptomyces sp. NPDC058240]|uniref:hypothetical protein n=1 Tax=Streptomyces sp. NPDC058240 TaxID=3346396 RepID=UPI0036ECC9D8